MTTPKAPARLDAAGTAERGPLLARDAAGKVYAVRNGTLTIALDDGPRATVSVAAGDTLEGIAALVNMAAHDLRPRGEAAPVPHDLTPSERLFCAGIGARVPYYNVRGMRAPCPVCAHDCAVVDDRDGSMFTITTDHYAAPDRARKAGVL